MPKEKDANVNLRDRLNDVPMSEKYIMESYHIGSKEIIDKQLYDLVMKNLVNVQKNHRQMFEQLFDLGEYQFDVATPAQVGDTFDVFNKYRTQFPYS